MRNTDRHVLLTLCLVAVSPCQWVLGQHVWEYTPPKGYVAYKASLTPVIDGKHDAVWHAAPWSETFNDIEGSRKPKPRFQTRMKMLWDDQFLYVFAEMEEPHLWGYQTRRDATIYHENDFEMFIKPSALTPQYGEFEMNVLGTPWDLFFMRPYRSGADYMMSWDMRTMQIGVHVNGTVNDPTDTDVGWNVELAFPWSALKELGRNRVVRDGDQWRINFSRVQWQHVVTPEGRYRRKLGPNGRRIREDNWTWSPQRAIQMHEPEYWGYLQLSDLPRGQVTFRRPEHEPILQTLFYLFRAKKANPKAASVEDLIGDNRIQVKGQILEARLEQDPFGFHIVVSQERGPTFAIDEREVVTKLP